MYVIAMLLASVAQAASFFSFGTPAGSPLHYAAYYWITDGILQVLVLGVVLSLVRRSAERRPAGIVTSRALAASALIVALVSFAAYGDRNLNTRMSLVARNIGFLAVLANLVLWAFLIRRRHPDRTVLLLSGGLGVEMAGKAIGHSLRTLAPSLVTVGNLVIVISYLFGLYVWWQAFRHWQPDPPPLSG
ncbi:MAG: hypothetical protein RMK57_15680 [Bryobacterales bacterium]|nr:hypothetical protein [Bryobacterales bacterium]